MSGRTRTMIAAAAAYTMTSTTCWAMDITPLEGGGPGLLLHGEIVKGDTDRIVPMLLRLYEQGKTPRLVVDSPGGNIMDADKLALLIRKAGIPVTVMAGRTCASACFLLFAASPERSASPLALIGVHSASLNGDENLLTLDLTTIMAREAAEFGVPADVIGRMVTTKPSDMAWLTLAELKEMGVRLLEAPLIAPLPERNPQVDQADGPSRPTMSSGTLLPVVSTKASGPAVGVSSGLVYMPADFAIAGSPAQGEGETAFPPHASIVNEPDKPDYAIMGSSSVSAPMYRPGSQ